MAAKEIITTGANGDSLRLYYYKTKAEDVKGTVLCLHGMAEHHGRYTDFFKKLNDNGYDVYTYDHRGHGKYLTLEELGFFGPDNGDELVIEDGVCAAKYVDENKRSAHFALFGHSMGSIISRSVIQRYDKMSCVILSGTAYQPDAMCKAGMILGKTIGLFCGKNHKSPLMNHIMFESKAYLRDCKKTKMDWLTRDEEIVDEYLKDDYSGFICSAQFYHDLGSLTDKAKKGMGETRRDLPILLASGEADPVGGFGKDVTALYNRYTEMGFTDVTMKLYPEDRHELLNELDKETVSDDFIGYINKYM